ncbi:MAG: anti-sigma regulatory factor [Tissierellia bacterium]|nr:ATP-binding protein [Bacillota bacterium]NLK59035.1 anti-sigma regulatory factor [Tissierellia bacterium]
MNHTVHLRIPAEPMYISVVRLTASSLASSLGFDIEEVEDIRVCVSEACNNVMDRLEDISLRFGVEENALTIDVDGFSSPSSEQGKLGYLIMSSLMDVVQETEQGIHMIKAKE